MSPSTNVTCSSNGTASIGSLEVLSIDVPAGKIRVKSPVNSWCYNTTTHSMGEQNTWIYDTSETAFRVSDTDNKLTVVGCNVLAYVWSRDGGADDKYIVGCNATCSRGMESLADGRCSDEGGCCQAPIRPGTSFELTFVDDCGISSGAAS